MTNRYFNTIVLAAFIIVGVFACKKDTPEEEIPVGGCIGSDKRDTIYSEIPNLDFENWYIGQGSKYLDPLPCNFWATPNEGSVFSIGTLKAPVTVFRVGADSAYKGNYAAMLVTGIADLGLLGKKITAGAIVSGKFQVKISDPLNSMEFGRSFNKKPKSVTGYYKYFPIDNDSASAYCYVTKNIGGGKVDTLGFGRQLFYDEKSTYTKFNFDLEYTSNEVPDRVVIYFTSSEAGDEFKGQVGNTIYIDNVTVDYHN